MMTSTFANYELGLSFFFACCAKATILLACAWLSVIALRRRSSAAQRHHVWAAAILARSLCLSSRCCFLRGIPPHLAAPPLSGVPPTRMQRRSVSHTIPSSIINVTAALPLFNKLAVAALLAWALGFSFVLLRLVAGLARLAWVSAHAKPFFDEDWMCTVLQLSKFHKIARPVRLLQCNSSYRDASHLGNFSPRHRAALAGAAQWPEDRRRIVLSHELAHIARHDWFLQICAELTRAIYWFHPLVWLAAAQTAPGKRARLR